MQRTCRAARRHPVRRATAVAGALMMVTAAGALGAAALPAGIADAGTSATLPQLTGFHQMVVDSSAGYVFLSEGLDSVSLLSAGTSDVSGIVVTSLSGSYVTTLDAGNGVEGLALSSGGGTLYAAVAPDGAVAAIAITSITPTTTIPTQKFYRLGAWEVPYGLAIQSGKLWVSFNPMQISPAGLSRIGYFDLSQAKPSFVVPNEITDAWYSAPDLAADPGNSGILIAYQPGMDPVDVASYDVAGSTVTTLAAEQELRNNGTELCANAGDLAVVPGGAKFIIACGWPYAHYYYGTAGLQMLGHYNSDAYPDAVVIAPDTGLVALGVDEPYAPSIYIYRPGGARPLNTYAFSYSDTKSVTLATRGLALSPDGSQLYALTTKGGKYTLHVFGHPARAKTALTLTGPSPAFAGYVTLTGKLTLASGPAPAPSPITVTRTGTGGTVTLPAVSTGAGGSFAVADAPAAGSYTYTASSSSPTGTLVASASFAVHVVPNTTKLTLTGSAHPNGSVSLNGSLTFNGSPAPAGTVVTVTRTVADTTVTTTLPPVTTTASGTFALTDKPGFTGGFVYTARYAGSATSGPATASVTVGVSK